MDMRTSRRLWLPGGLLFFCVLALGAGLWLVQWRGPARDARQPLECSGPAPRSPACAWAPSSVSADAPAPVTPSAASSSAQGPPPDLPRDSFVDDDPVVAEQPLWKADYGDGVRRGAGRVEFELLDAKGQPLEPGVPIDFELWRKVGKHRLREGARLNAARTAIVCDAFDGGGLEPGGYELVVSCGPYGGATRAFGVSRGELRIERLEMPHWRRIIVLSFTDKEGKPLAYLPLPPRYTAPGTVTTVVERTPRPRRVLREPPQPSRSAVGLGGSSSSSRRMVRPSSPTALRFPTDHGKWYVRVFAGGPGSIRFELDEKLFGQRQFEVAGDFTESQWDNFITAYDVPADFAAVMELRELCGAEDPGCRSLLEPLPLPREPDLYDVLRIPEGYRRLIVSIAAPCPVTPTFWVEYEISQPKGKNPGPRQVSGTWHAQLGRWWIDLPPDSSVEVELSSPQLLQPGGRVREAIFLGESRILEIHRTFEASLLQVTCPSPTLAALSARLAAHCNGVYSPEGAAPWQSDGTLRLYVERGPESFEGQGLVLALKLFSGRERSAAHTVVVRPDEGQRRELALGGTTVAARGEGLVLRAVDSSLAGLPWVEGTVLEFDQDVASKRLRKHWMGSAAEMEECYELLCTLAAKDVEAGHPDALRLNELLEKLADPSSREWLKREGSWYSTHSRVFSSDHGYLNLEKGLEPGKRYVLYLWSGSRDEMTPDRRIDFVAAEGITDLGVVILPGYGD